MRTCPRCERTFPEVEGAATQQCPHCGHEMPTRGDAVGGAPALVVDPAGAAAFALGIYRGAFGRLLVAWLPALVAELAYVGILASYASQMGVSLSVDAFFAAPLRDQLRLAGLVLPLVILTYAVQLAMWARAARVVQATVAPGETIPRGPGTGPVFLLGLTLAVVHAAGLLLIVPFLVFFHWFLFAPAALASGAKGTWAALDASRRFARDRRTAGYTALVLLAFFTAGVLGEVAAAVTFAVGPALGAPALLTADVARALVGWVLNPLVAVLPASLFFLARHAPAPESAPAAAGSAADRFRTTKCPGCGTLVPYTATGEPVDVTCPTCGRSGRVL